jgi:hypothetical protein
MDIIQETACRVDTVAGCVNRVTNLRVPYNVRDVLASRTTISLSRTQLYEVIYLDKISYFLSGDLLRATTVGSYFI